MNRTIPITMDIVYNKIDILDWLITPQEVIKTSYLNAMNLILKDSEYDDIENNKNIEQKFDFLKQEIKKLR